VADVADFLRSNAPARIPAIHTSVNARRRQRNLPAVSEASVRGALNANKNGKGHGLFQAKQRGLYSLVDD
jgi:hypothetical protein